MACGKLGITMTKIPPKKTHEQKRRWSKHRERGCRKKHFVKCTGDQSTGVQVCWKNGFSFFPGLSTSISAFSARRGTFAECLCLKCWRSTDPSHMFYWDGSFFRQRIQEAVQMKLTVHHIITRCITSYHIHHILPGSSVAMTQ